MDLSSEVTPDTQPSLIQTEPGARDLQPDATIQVNLDATTVELSEWTKTLQQQDCRAGYRPLSSYYTKSLRRDAVV